MTGTVTDTTGAIIPNAQVTITNLGTGVKTQVSTGSAGTYTVSGLIPGTYTLAVAAPGFQKYVQTQIHIEVSTTATINATLKAGSSTQTVEVTSNPIALNTTQPQIGTVIEPKVVASLPFEVGGRGRQIDSVQFLAPGVTGNTFSHRVDGGVDFEQEILYNGIPAPQPETAGYTTNFNPPFEMVNQVKIQRTTFAAQYGLGQGALSYQMASGTNHYHGDLFEINRNSMFDSEGFFNGPAWGLPARVPTDHENNYGFTVAGPVSIPKIYNGRDKTFFHYSQEWYKQNNMNTSPSTVPTALEKTGDFSDFVDGGTGLVIPIYVPPGVTCGGLTPGQQFPGNKIPAACISPTSQILLQYLPDPDSPGTGVGGLNSNKSYTPFNNPHIQHVWGYTIDQVLTPSQSIHWSQWRNSFSNWSFDNSPMVVAPNPLNSMKYEPALGSGFLLNYDYTISPRMILTLGAGWIGEINNQYNQTKYSFPAVQGGVIPTNITFGGQHAPTSWGTSGAWLQSINRKLGVALVGNLLWTKGRNTFNIGGEFRRALQDDNEEQTAGGHFNFSNLETSDPNSPNFGSEGSGFASYLLGLPDSANRSNSQELRLRNLDFSPYFQDDLKVTPKLTVNLGVRWDMMVPFTEMHNNIVYFDPSIPNPAADGILGAVTKFGNCTGCAGFNRAPMHWGHIGPRFGFAYQINNKTVVQGGFSIAFLDGGAYEYGTNKVAVNYGNLLVGSYAVNSSGSNVSAYGSWDSNIMPNPPATAFNPGLGVGGPQVNVFSKNDGFAPYSQQWSVNLQRELPYQMFATLAWVGNRDIHLPSQLNSINQINPKYFALGNDLNLNFSDGSAQAAGYQAPYAGFASMWGSSATVAQSLVPYPQYGYLFNNFEGKGTAFYQSMQLQLEKRFTNGLSFLAGYTLAREYNNTGSGFSSFISNSLNKYNQKLEWSPTSGAPPQAFKVSGTYELPIGPGKRFFSNRGVTGQVLGGWQVGWILDYESGTPTGVGQNLDFPYPNGGGQRPNRNTSVSLGTASYNKALQGLINHTQEQIFNPNAFTKAPQYTLGDSYRTYSALKNPAYYMENGNVRKHFYFGDRFQGILDISYFNLFNRTQLPGPDTNFSSGTYGQVTGTYSNISNRQGQVQFRLQF
ncbi:MAG TPA: carboxypeptidase-like regulatory domain-containing protein [Acidobacteriaceae bacterium]|nr:carboxypeptidase-like regulatory domain-containing protein [Acidobacteriaceae bacterium]